MPQGPCCVMERHFPEGTLGDQVSPVSGRSLHLQEVPRLTSCAFETDSRDSRQGLGLTQTTSPKGSADRIKIMDQRPGDGGQERRWMGGPECPSDPPCLTGLWLTGPGLHRSQCSDQDGILS